MSRLLQRALQFYTEHLARLTTIGAVLLLAPFLGVKLLQIPIERRLLATTSETGPDAVAITTIIIFNIMLR